ncbi:MAG: hypothetical protein IKI77_09055 [Oscillospiraceae bacterium]|nr:hypothetical protein [Oscillospiraceae bacterium]
MQIQKLTAVCSAAVILLGALPMLPAAAAGTDLYVGYPDRADNFTSVQAAVNAAASRKPSSENDRVTVHIAPGIYREQVTVNTPYISFVNDTPSQKVTLTWYYGIGYKYYSVGSNGEYSADAARAKNAKYEPTQRWGCSVRLRSGSKYFRAEHITFENSFNRYVTDEELADGVEVSGSQSITFRRTKGADVQVKAATERAAALAIEADYCEFLGCDFQSSQDTLYIGGGIGYFKDCMIEGNTDYIFGQGGTYVFDGCELRFKGYSSGGVGGYITAMKDSKRTLFSGCRVTAGSLPVSAGYFGRPWGASADVAFVNTQLQYESIITGAGWTSMSGNQPENAKFKEYGTTCNGAPVNTGSRVRGTVQYSANGLDVQTYLGAWVPFYLNGGVPREIPAINGTLVRELKPFDSMYPWKILQNMPLDAKLYTDREYAFRTLPEQFAGSEQIVTPCDAKNIGGDLAEMTAAADISVYIVMDRRNQNLPAWMSGYTDTGIAVESTDNETYGLWKQDFAAGTKITLGTNGMTGKVTNYTVIVTEQQEAPPEPTVSGDVTCDDMLDARDLSALKQHLLRQVTLTGTALANADADRNGTVDSSDLALLKAYLCTEKTAF